MASNLIPRGDLSTYDNARFAKAFARIENHFFTNGALPDGLSPKGYLLENVDKIAHIDIHIVQGRFDQVCPRYQADELVTALKAVQAQRLEYIVTSAGHSQYDKENVRALTKIMDLLSSPVVKKRQGLTR